MQDAEKINIAKPVASKPFSNYRFFPELGSTAMSPPPPPPPPPPLPSFAEKTIATKPNTTRFEPTSNDIFATKDIVSESVASHLFSTSVATLRADSKSNVVYKPTAKLVSRATASFLAKLGNSVATHQQPTPNNQLPVQVLEQAKPNHDYPNSSPQSDTNQKLHEPPNSSVPQNMELDMRNQQQQQQQQQPVAGMGDIPSSSYDGYNWRKYGQKQVKGSEFPRSYYKCTHPTCPVKKKVERSFDGQIAEIVYKGEHNHAKPPQPPKRLSAVEPAGNNPSWSRSSSQVEANAAVSAGGCMDQHNEVVISLPGINQMLFCHHDPPLICVHGGANKSSTDAGTRVRSRAGGLVHDKLDYKRRKNEHHFSGSKSVGEGAAEPHSVMHTSMEPDISGDGYNWRKYGQKLVKGNTYPRSYYRCTSPKCNVRKYVERASDGSDLFVTTYEGKHNHQMPGRKVNFAASDPHTTGFDRSNHNLNK